MEEVESTSLARGVEVVEREREAVEREAKEAKEGNEGDAGVVS